MTSNSLTEETFVSISSALTGVTTSQLSPKFDPIGIAGQYFETLNSNVSGATLDALALAFPADLAPKEAAAAALANPTLGPVCRSIMKLWLLGTWYAPDQPTNALKVVSSQAYKESLIWKMMQSHPMGYSMFTFGYWDESPPPLDKFVDLVSHQDNA